MCVAMMIIADDFWGRCDFFVHAVTILNICDK